MTRYLAHIILFLISSISGLSQSMCPLTPGTDLITNGNFSSGNTGFTNTFTFYSGGSPMPGDNYAIGTNPNPYNTGFFKSMSDHTTGTGNMLIFDFNNNSANDALWQQTISVVNGQTYFFSAWFANIAINNYTSCGSCPGGQYITNSPQLQFQITGTPNFTSPIVKVDSITNNWNQYFTTYTAGATGSITIKIINLRTGNISNDLALDDISFSNGCEKITNLNSLGQTSVLPDTVYNCNVAFPYTLDPGLPGTYGYAWKMVPGTTLATTTTYAVPPTPADGTKYYLCYSYINGCPRKDSVLFRSTPVTVNLGPDKTLCNPISNNISSGVMAPPATIQWFKDGAPIPGETNSTYTATSIGTYSLTAARAGCTFNTTDNIVISNPSSTFAGSGTYCSSNNTATFSVTSGTTKVAWFTQASGGTPLNPLDSLPSISPALSATNTTTAGCTSGLYAQDVSSYPGALMPSIPAGNSATNNNNSAGTMTMIQVSQSLTLTSFDFSFPSGWSTSGTFTLKIYANDPAIGPWCGSCSPNGRYGGPTGAALYSVTTPTLNNGNVTTQFTVNTNYTLAPGYYWFDFESTSGGVPFSYFNTAPSGYQAGSILWSSPYADNTGNNVLKAVSAIQGASPGTNNGNVQGAGNIYNLKFQVGSSNTCSRLWICASANCTAPVKFISLDASRNGNTNTLVWKTASEMNSANFIVERSIDGINFSPVGKVTAAGNSSTVLSYSYQDYFANSGTVYYRILETDFDGKQTLSSVATVTTTETSYIRSVFPIPVKKGDAVEIEFNNELKEALTIDAIDNLGRIVVSTKFAAESGINKIEIGTASLPTGTYYVRISGGTVKITKILVE